LIVLPKLWALVFIGNIVAQHEGICRRRGCIRCDGSQLLAAYGIGEIAAGSGKIWLL
jgi:hypothetical protein